MEVTPQRPAMIRQRTYGIADGAIVGALPFWILAIFRSGERWPGWCALGVGLILATTAFRTPLAWGLGVVAGAVLSWAGLAILVGTDWRLLPYVLVGFSGYYLSVTTAVVAAYWIGTTRVPRRG